MRGTSRKARIATGPSPEGTVVVARAGVVSWLRDRRTRLPDLAVSGVRVRELLPLQWRGRTGVAPVSVAPARHINCGLNLSHRFAIFNRLQRDQLAHERLAPGAVVFTRRSLAAISRRIHAVERDDFARQHIRGRSHLHRNRRRCRRATTHHDA